MTPGIAVSVKSNLGVSPLSSIPYTITSVFGMEMGNATFLNQVVLVLLQILLLRKNFKWINLCQVVVGIIFGKIIGKIAGISPSFICLLYFARFANLMGYILIVAIAIYLSPVLKKTMSMFALIPMALMMGSMVSYDMLLIAGSFLYVSLCLRLMYKPEAKWNWKYAVTFGAIAFLFIAVKIIYLPLYLWLFLILLEDKDKKELVKRIGFVVLVFIILYALTSVIPLKMSKVFASG